MSGERGVQHLFDRLRLMIAPVKINVVDDSKGTQTQQIDLGPQAPEGSLGIRDGVPVLLAFGFVSNPPPGSDALALHVGGDRSNAVIIAHGNQKYRLTGLGAGDAGIHDIRGAYVWLTSDGPVIDAAGGKVTIQNASDIDVTGSGTVTLTANKVVVDCSDIELGGAGGKKVALDGDPVVGGVVVASSTAVTAL